MPTDHESDGGEGQTSTDEPSDKMCTWRPDEEETSIFPTDTGHTTVTAPTPYRPASGEEQVVMAAAKVSTAVHVSGTCTPAASVYGFGSGYTHPPPFVSRTIN